MQVPGCFLQPSSQQPPAPSLGSEAVPAVGAAPMQGEIETSRRVKSARLTLSRYSFCLWLISLPHIVPPSFPLPSPLPSPSPSPSPSHSPQLFSPPPPSPLLHHHHHHQHSFDPSCSLPIGRDSKSIAFHLKPSPILKRRLKLNCLVFSLLTCPHYCFCNHQPTPTTNSASFRAKPSLVTPLPFFSPTSYQYTTRVSQLFVHTQHRTRAQCFV